MHADLALSPYHSFLCMHFLILQSLLTSAALLGSLGIHVSQWETIIELLFSSIASDQALLILQVDDYMKAYFMYHSSVI